MKRVIAIMLLLAASAAAQSEILNNGKIIEMVKAGIGDALVVSKIKAVDGDFDTSADGMIELKKAGVSDNVIAAMMEKPRATVSLNNAASSKNTNSTDARPNPLASPASEPKTPREILSAARTIAFVKSSANPSRQALEKELLKRKDWQALNLTIDRYKDSADLYVEIGFVTMSLITHRYVYRIYDRRTGTVIAAGETTSWGSLAENLARHITGSLSNIAKSQ